MAETNLIFSRTFARRFVFSLAAIALVTALAWHMYRNQVTRAFDQLHIHLLISAHSLDSTGIFTWSILGLLSSACCLLQVILNAFALGCAGFNTYLGPLRPSF